MIGFCRIMGAIFLAIGFFMLLGTAGASECATISEGQFWVQAMIGTGIAGAGVLLTNVAEE